MQEASSKLEALSHHASKRAAGKSAARTTPGRVLVENIESLGIAIVMALVLKYFLIEAYKIPTGSMQPTIIGSSQVSDRVLVNKYIYLLSEPQRFDVIVFKWPFDQTTNYIKRLIGKPGETVQIRNGDIYVAEKGKTELQVVRKSRKAREAVMKLVYPGLDQPNGITPSTPLSDAFPNSVNVKFTGPSSALIEKGTNARLVYARQETNQLAGYRGGIRDYPWHGYDPKLVNDLMTEYPTHDAFWVGDLEIRAKVKPLGNGTIGAEIKESGRVHTASIAVGEGGESFLTTQSDGQPSNGSGTPAQRTPLSVRLEPGRAHEIAFMNIDDTLILEIDGDEVGRLEYVTPDQEDPPQRNRISLTVDQCGAEVSNVEILRDIYYYANDSGSEWRSQLWQVPENHYFALGDNTQNSSDSRLWREQKIELKDGRVLTGAYSMSGEDRNPKPVRDGLQFKDEHGEVYTLAMNDIKAYKDLHKPQPFIPGELLLGKAIFVFWPIWPFAPTMRFKFIH